MSLTRVPATVKSAQAGRADGGFLTHPERYTARADMARCPHQHIGTRRPESGFPVAQNGTKIPIAKIKLST
jgi:hypothetical protein